MKARLAKFHEKCVMYKKAREHAKKAILDLATKKESQLSLCNSIYKALKGDESNRKFTKGKAITRENMQSLFDELVIHA